MRRFLQPILFVIGLFLVALAVTMLVPALVNLLIRHNEWQAFTLSAVLTGGVGLSLARLFCPQRFELSMRQMFLLTTASWLSVSLFAALPLLTLPHLSYTDAFFETMSGITTTGSTVLTQLESLSPGVLIWRSLLQWIGGIGFIVMGVAVLPFLKVGGMRLFQTESSEWTDKAMPRAASMAKAILLIYLLLTIACFGAYFLAGMNAFNAINHAMTTVSTGGYSTFDSSMGHYQQPAIHWLSILFMALGSLPFLLYVRFFQGEPGSLLQDQQVRGFVFLLLWSSLLFALVLWAKSDINPLDAWRLSLFNLTSVVTTTGYALGDYSTWGHFAVVGFLFFSLVGGCSGSTAGGIKIFRLQLAWMLVYDHLHRLFYPHAVLKDRYNQYFVNEDIVRSLIGFSVVYFLTVVVLAFLLSLFELDALTALSGAITAVANVGPGLGDIIGPAGNFATLPNGAKWLLCLGMLMGRLEIITVLALLTPLFWRR